MTTTINAFIKLVPASLKQTITTEELKELFYYYKDITAKTGKQLGWDYEHHAFPYDLKDVEEGKGRWFYLKSDMDRYNLIVISISQEKIKEYEEERIQNYIQISLTGDSTHGDKAKANEFCKFLSKQLQGELHLFNNRIMYYYKRR